ncbi:hypothetical protein BU26DRAFT_12880 [Trematosphaeria pertusa]|uniref:Uncharacterized protein n=1 Tax=Trematosphaeria pertusa TaxID=390896 RepID=A0A6A6IZV5_9PLEO|nr:uncharacterized protein BU26DRAFT_12880 [Trematosphaeria pertusa]KAF2255979.1 hypothetical protein BU26DRAFT_12880 [Trematosphaeria pertusa]
MDPSVTIRFGPVVDTVLGRLPHTNHCNSPSSCSIPPGGVLTPKPMYVPRKRFLSGIAPTRCCTIDSRYSTQLAQCLQFSIRFASSTGGIITGCVRRITRCAMDIGKSPICMAFLPSAFPFAHRISRSTWPLAPPQRAKRSSRGGRGAKTAMMLASIGAE